MEIYPITVWINACYHTPITVIRFHHNSKLLIFTIIPKDVTICRFLVAFPQLNVRQSSMIFQGEMISYMSHFFLSKIDPIPFIVVNLWQNSMCIVPKPVTLEQSSPTTSLIPIDAFQLRCMPQANVELSPTAIK